jgi:FkbH-like protein
MRLKKEQLAAWYIGWEAKSAGLLQIARTLNLDVHSFVLVDDNPAELAEVQAALPGVACLRMPDDPAQWRVVIQGAGVLDRLPPTAEDLERAKQYQQEQRRRQVLASSPTPAEYLANLGVAASIFPPTSATLPRLAQLIAKTNQLNLNGKRREESDLARLVIADDYLVRLVQVQDHFGDYGIVGAFIVKIQDDHADLDTFLLSCRAMGRGIEEAMIAELFAALAERGVGEVYATVEAQPRNEPARRFFARIGCEVAGLRVRLERLVWPAYVRREKAA